MEIVYGMFDERSRDTAKTWHTAHTCVFDIASRKMTIWSQEDYTKKYDFFCGGFLNM